MPVAHLSSLIMKHSRYITLSTNRLMSASDLGCIGSEPASSPEIVYLRETNQYLSKRRKHDEIPFVTKIEPAVQS